MLTATRKESKGRASKVRPFLKKEILGISVMKLLHIHRGTHYRLGRIPGRGQLRNTFLGIFRLKLKKERRQTHLGHV